MTSEAQLKNIAAQVDEAVAGGPKLLPAAGAIRSSRALLRAHSARRCRSRDDSHVRRNLGPVIPIMKVNDSQEAVRLANDSRYGLSAAFCAR